MAMFLYIWTFDRILKQAPELYIADMVRLFPLHEVYINERRYYG